METHHYLGSGPLCGAQRRFLIQSKNLGWLGGLAFSAAAWRVADRDRWIGWSKAWIERFLVRAMPDRCLAAFFGDHSLVNFGYGGI
jgi:hypothetical protein